MICIPAMREIRRLFPDAVISLLIRPWVRDIYSAVDFIDEIIEYDKEGRHRGKSGLFRLISELKRRQFDLAVLLQNAFEAAFIAWCAGIPDRIGYARDARSLLLTRPCRIAPEVLKVHQGYYYLGMLSSAGLIAEDPWSSNRELDIRIGVRKEDSEAAREMLRASGIAAGDTIIGINPGAYYGPAKRWFPDRYAAVADRLVEEYGARVAIFGSASDLRTAEELQAGMKHKPVILAGRTTLGQLMGLLKECRLLITNDSGPMHLAAALGVPQLAIFGSTSEVATGPLSRRAVVIKHQVDCNPCFLRECPSDFACMKNVTTEQVFDAARTMLS